MDILTFIFTIIVAVATNILAADLYDRCPIIARELIRWAGIVLPKHKQDQYSEEWVSHLSDSQTKLTQIKHAMGCVVCALKLRWSDDHALPVERKLQPGIEAAYDALLKAAQLRDTFVHHVSYELRSPLTNIIGFTQLLGDESVGSLNERQREYSDHIMRSSAALLVIINDILDLASIDAGALELKRESVDVRATVEAAVRGIADRLAESRITLDLDVPNDIGMIHADGKRIRQILFNLLSNAVGFSHAGQRVKLEAQRDGEYLVLAVHDHGRGIPADIVDSVFNRFESHTLGTRHRGVGLGLSIVRSFVEAHGGRVKLSSQPGIGTTVTCWLPLK